MRLSRDENRWRWIHRPKHISDMITSHMKAFKRSGSAYHDLIKMEWLCHICGGNDSGPKCIWHTWASTCRCGNTVSYPAFRGHHVNQTPLFDTLMEKFSAFRVRWYFHHKFIHLTFLSGPRHRDTGTVTASDSIDICWLSMTAIFDTRTSSGCRISPYKDSFTSPIYPGNHSVIIGLDTRPCIPHLG